MGCSAKGKARRIDVISVILNGEPRQVREGSIADLVASLGLEVMTVAVDRNSDIVPRSTLAAVDHAEGGALERLHLGGRGWDVRGSVEQTVTHSGRGKVW